jgi:hypothetical protein
MRLVLVMVLAACGSQPTSSRGPAQPGAPGAAPPGPPPKPAITAEVFCEHVNKLASKCDRLANMRMDPADCRTEFGAELDDSKDGRVLQIATCIVEHDDCDDVLDCVAAGQSDPTVSEALRACDDAGPSTEHAVGIPRAEWDQRNGANVTAFRDAHSTKATPIEMCGVSAANDWLVSLRCDDGSQPLKNRADAEDFRSGNLGPGGRCHSIIDRYVVLCPERRYEVFIDAYMCPRPD